MPEPARVAFITTSLSVGGAERMLVKILGALDRRRYAPEVYSVAGDGPAGDDLRALGIPVHLPSKPARLSAPWRALGLARAVAREGFDLLQGWMYHGNLVALAAARLSRPRPRVALAVRASLDEPASFSRAGWLVMKANGRWSARADAITYNSQRGRGQHEARAGFAPAIGVVIGNGFDSRAYFPDREAGLATRERLGIPATAPLVGILGRHHPMKDQETFLRAAAHIRAQVPEAHFVLAGPGLVPDNPSLAALVDGTALAGCTHLLGDQAQTLPLYQAMDLFCLTSVGEGFPNVLGEAMACALPCVATDVGDCGAILGDCGAIAPPKDDRAIAAACVKMLALDAASREALGAAARRRVIEAFSIPAVAGQYEALYARLLAGKAVT